MFHVQSTNQTCCLHFESIKEKINPIITSGSRAFLPRFLRSFSRDVNMWRARDVDAMEGRKSIPLVFEHHTVLEDTYKPKSGDGTNH